MSLDFYLEEWQKVDVHSLNVTHNLSGMAHEAGLYGLLWRPEENRLEHAEQLIAPLETAIAAMKCDPERFRKHNPPNGWGTYEGFLEVCENLLAACHDYPASQVRARP